MIACLAEDKLDLVYTGMVFLIFGCVNKTSHLVTNLSKAVLQSKLGLVESLKWKIQQKKKQNTVRISPEVFVGFVFLLLLTCTINALSSWVWFHQGTGEAWCK